MPIISVFLRLAVVLLTALLAAGLSGCDSDSTLRQAGDTARQVTVVGNGKVDGAPDTLTANVAITAVAPDVTGAMNQSSEQPAGCHRRADGAASTARTSAPPTSRCSRSTARAM